MSSILSLVLVLFFALPAVAAESSPCVPDACHLGRRMEQWPSFAKASRGITLDSRFVMKQGPALAAEFSEAICPIYNRCLAVPGQSFTFCGEVATLEARKICGSRYPKEKSFDEWDQCLGFATMWGSAVENQVIDKWNEAQACAKDAPPAEVRKLKVWIEPKALPMQKKVKIQVFAVDAENGTPIYGKVLVDGKPIRADEIDPTGTIGTYYRAPVTLRQSDGKPPRITVEAPGFETAVVEYEME
jgi:hypothetical protein